MIFVACLYPIEMENRARMSYENGFFIMREMVKNKKYWLDENLDLAHNLIWYYTWYYTDPCYCYLMTDNYWYKSKIANENHPVLPDAKIGTFGWITRIDRLPHNYEDYVANRDKYPHEFIQEENRRFSKDDIDKVFKKFELNNFRTNPCCGAKLGGD